LRMLEMIAEIAILTPSVRHWLPTREMGIVKQFLQKHSVFPANLTVRLSAPMVGEGFAKRPMGLPMATVDVPSDSVEQCKAPAQANKCLDCSHCWDKSDVNYHYH